MSAEPPVLITGGIAVDDRGTLSFANDFGFPQVKRFYIVRNHHEGFVRAWHAHRREAKYVVAVAGAAVVAAVEIDDWDQPSRDQPVYRYVLSSAKPSVLCIPAGYANGFMSLTDDAALMFFSTATMDESQGDDVRFDARYLDPWMVDER